MGNRKVLSEDLKQTVVNLTLKGNSLRKIGQLINKTYSTVQHIVNKFKYTESIKNELQNQRDECSVLDKKGMYSIKYEKVNR